MKRIHPSHHLKTSVSIPQNAYRRILASRKIFARHAIYFSEQEIYRRIFKLFLKNWRGRGRKTNGLRRYNCSGKNYEIHPLYINQVLHSALLQRATHSGESLSRMLDVAIRLYLPRLLETLLGTACSSGVNQVYWARRYAQRIYKFPDFFINYECVTGVNSANRLEFQQKTEIISKVNLSPMEIWDLLQKAA